MSRTRWSEEHEYFNIHYCETSATHEEPSETSSYLDTEEKIVFGETGFTSKPDDEDWKGLTVREYFEEILCGKKVLNEIKHCGIFFNGKSTCLDDVLDQVVGEGDYIKMYSQPL